MTLGDLRETVMEEAVHRTKPKPLTELTTLIGLTPMLWASGVGSELMRPMAVPVLGGMLFYRIRLKCWQKIHGIAGNLPNRSEQQDRQPVEAALV